MKLTRTLSAFGVLTVAVAALATGPVAAYAADAVGTDSAQTVAAGDSATGKLVLKAKDGSFYSLSTSTTNVWLEGKTHTTQAEAEAASSTLTIPKIGRTAPIVNEAGQCLVIRTVTGHNNKYWGDFSTCTGGANQNFYWDTVNGVNGLRSGTDAKNSFVSIQPETYPQSFVAGSSSADFTGAVGSAVVEGRLTLDSPANGSLIREDKPTFSGVGTSGGTIEILNENGDLLARTVVVDGKWSKQLTDALPQGVHKGTIRQILNGVETTVAYEFTYRVVQGVSVTSPALDGTVDVARPVFSGKGEPGAQVTIINNANDAKLIDTTVDENGDWRQQSLYTLTKGTHEATATQLYNGASTTAPVRFTYGAAAPVTPVTLTSPGWDAVISDGRPTFAGKGQPGAEVTVRGSSGKVLATTAVKTDGTWSVQSTYTLGDAKYIGTATQVSGSSTTTAPFRYEIKTVSQTPVVVTAPAFNGSVATSRPVFAGKGTAGASITIKGNSGAVIATTTVNGDGTWSVAPSFDLPVSKYIASAIQNASGTITDAPIRYSIVSTVKIAKPVKDSTINTRNTVFSGTGEKGAEIVVKGSSGKVLGTTTVADNGTWTVTSSIALGDGMYIGDAIQTINGLTVKDSFRYYIKL